MGSCLSFLFNSHCPGAYDECRYENNNCDNMRVNNCSSNYKPNCTQNQSVCYQSQQLHSQVQPVRRYNLENPNNYVCISCGAYHTSPYSITCQNCQSSTNNLYQTNPYQTNPYQTNPYQQPKPSAPPL